MGHERLGLLPKSKKWKDIIEDIKSFQAADIEINEIVRNTLKGVISRFEKLPEDSGVIASFESLVIFAVSLKSTRTVKFLKKNSIKLEKKFNTTELAKAIFQYIKQREESKEYSKIAKKSAIDAIITWYEKNKKRQLKLFESFDNSLEVWKKLGTGAGFCELSRYYFSNFITSYLKYFLEREASSSSPDLLTRQQFNNQLELNIETVSKYAFETSKITQSYAAGWFNKKAKYGLPSRDEIVRFINYSFGKMKEEILREL